MMHLPPPSSGSTRLRGAISVNSLVALVFFTITLIASLLLFGVYLQQRDAVVAKVGKIEAQQTAGLIFEHLYSVMRKGWTREEIDDVIHHISNRLPDYTVDVVRGEAVARQFGELPGDLRKRTHDPLVAAVLASRQDVFFTDQEQLRYGFAVKMKAECTACHSNVKPGEINGVILVGIPSARLKQPIEAAIKPMTGLAGAVILVLFGAVFFALRAKVVKPMQEFASRVEQSSDHHATTRIPPKSHWPKEIISLASNFNGLMERIEQDQRLLEDSSQRDSLTRLFNRRRFDVVLAQAKADADNGADPFSVLLLDLDDFKPINDQHGHAAGDAVLVAVANAIQATLREADLVARIGGDEFAIIAVATGPQAAEELRERIRNAVLRQQTRFGHQMIGVQCSIGSASYDGNLADVSELLEAADSAMYQDKARRKQARLDRAS